MRAATLLLVAACGGDVPWKPLPPAAPQAFCPALAKGDLKLAAAAASSRHRAVGGGSDLRVVDALEAWLHAQPCVVAVEDDVCNGLGGLVFETRARHVQVVLYPTAIQLNPTPPCTTRGPVILD